ncbi:MAG: inositol monophosphatase family protein [Burkholderiales bacterium]
MHPMLTIAVKAARRAGTIINRAAQDIDALTVSTKRHNDFVTEVDQAAEQAVIQILRKAFPDHAILAEESGAHGKSDYVWIIDPLDGTTNFIHGFPQYCTSIGLRYKGSVTQAVIYDPARNELYTATRGHGAYLNDRRMRVSKRKQLDDALIGTGFPFREVEHIGEYMPILRQVMGQTAGVRRAGSAALDLAYVAAGRLDGFWETGLSPWDMAAGSLLIQEAGGLVSDFHGDGDFLDSGDIVAGTPKVFAPLLQIIAAQRAARLP